MRTQSLSCCLAAALLLSLIACKKPAPPADDKPPEPQTQHTQLRDAMRKPLQQAHNVEDAALKADAQRQKELEASGG